MKDYVTENSNTCIYVKYQPTVHSGMWCRSVAEMSTQTKLHINFNEIEKSELSTSSRAYTP